MGEHMMYVGMKETDFYAGNFVSCGSYCYLEVQLEIGYQRGESWARYKEFVS